MLKDTPELTKFKRLQADLMTSKAETVGILELLWRTCGIQTPQGNIGKLSNEDIRDECGCTEIPPDRLVESLVKWGWLDACKEHRLVVHDWGQHMEGHIKVKLKRANLPVLTSTSPPKSGCQNTCSDHVIESRVPNTCGEERNGMEWNGEERNGSSARGTSKGYTPQFEEWFKLYPKRVGKADAAKAFSKAVDRVELERLLERTTAFAESDIGKGDRQFVPNPATWLNQDRWLDDPEAWSTGKRQLQPGEVPF